VTDANGQARTTLATTTTADVTAIVAGKTSPAARVTVGDRAGTVAIGVPATITEDQPASFTFTITSGGTNAPRIANLRIEWGDGSVSNLGQVGSTATTVHTYLEDGPYTIVATLFDDAGGQTSSSTQIFVQEAPSIPVTVTVGTCPGGDGCNPNEPVPFTANATAPAGSSISRYVWDWGDNSSDQTTGNTASHSYREPGTYTVTVTAFATNGTSGSGQTQVQIVRGTVAVTASSSCPGGTCETGEQITFTAAATPPSGTTITSYEWTFGDGGRAQGRQVSHAYNSPGTYPVTVTVTASNGSRGSDTISIGVNPAP
jgi:PKD repeat protein